MRRIEGSGREALRAWWWAAQAIVALGAIVWALTSSRPERVWMGFGARAVAANRLRVDALQTGTVDAMGAAYVHQRMARALRCAQDWRGALSHLRQADSLFRMAQVRVPAMLACNKVEAGRVWEAAGQPRVAASCYASALPAYEYLFGESYRTTTELRQRLHRVSQDATAMQGAPTVPLILEPLCGP